MAQYDFQMMMFLGQNDYYINLTSTNWQKIKSLIQMPHVVFKYIIYDIFFQPQCIKHLFFFF